MIADDDINFGSQRRESLDIAFVSGTTDSENHLPPYYSLAYVMYIGPED